MPRDVNGNYNLPAGNPVQSNELIETTWANPTMSDIGVEIADSLSRSGKGSMAVALKLSDNGYAFNNELTSGLVRVAPGELRLKALNQDFWRTNQSTKGLDGLDPLTGDFRTTSVAFADVFRDYGAKGDGVTNDLTAFQNAIDDLNALGGGVLVVPATSSFYAIGGALDLKEGVILFSFDRAIVKFTSASEPVGHCVLRARTGVKGLQIRAANAPGSQCFYTNNANELVIENCFFDSEGAYTGTWFQCNSVASSIHILKNLFTGGNYHILVNSAANGSGLFVEGNTMQNPLADCIELNTTGGLWSETVIANNVLDASSAGTSSNSGFAIGLAYGRNVTITGNLIKNSRQEAIHIEDRSERVAVTGNTISMSADSEDGVRVLNNPTDITKSVTITGNILTSTATTPGMGIQVVFNPEGTPLELVIDGNYITGWSRGISVGRIEEGAVISNNLVKDCALGFFAARALCANMENNSFTNCTTVFQINEGGSIGHQTVFNFTTLLVINTGIFVIAGLKTTFRYDHPGGGSAFTNIFPTPTRFLGRITADFLTIGVPTDVAMKAEETIWSGSSESEQHNAVYAAGGLSNPEVRFVGGNLQAGVFRSAAATVTGTFRVEGSYAIAA